MNSDIKDLLLGVKNGDIEIEKALLELKEKPFTDIDIAKIDNHRKIMQGTAEIIYGEGKTYEQINKIIAAMKNAGQERILITRLSSEKAEKIKESFDITYDKLSKVAYSGELKKPDGLGTVIVASAGTSDLPVAREAMLTLKFLGNEVKELNDVGVSGLHRLLSYLDDIASAKVIIAIAGMEGALASVIAGLADCPVIAVPTSVGYGASFEGVTALLSMMNSCASGVSVVNIDNGFGAGYTASMINHMEA
ncbi:MAG: nickel pincer cofactor biosynthesis protein LarB [Clostridia bacterium]|nr:nickel pincer cofactor biosynthesis protein LarB [Clostridia bacterium]